MKVLIYGINYAPELTGIGKYTSEMAVTLADHGHEVRVITAPPYYPDWKVCAGYSSSRYMFECLRGVSVWRAPLWVPTCPNGVKRLLHLASFAFSSIPLLFRHLFWRPHVVWVVAPALFCAPGACLVARLAGARCWLHIQDFEVDAAFELGILKGKKIRSLVLIIECLLLRRFDRVSTISHQMVERLRQKGVAKEKTVFFPNWVSVETIRPLPAKGGVGGALRDHACDYRAILQIQPSAIVALYSGNMGGKQGLDVLSQAAALSKDRINLVWVFCGEGVERINLEQDCAGFENVRFLPLQPVEHLNELLNLADIHLLPQREDVADLVMPSKLTGMLASGRPVVAVATLGTQVANVCEKCGIVVSPGNVDAFVEAVLLLADNDPLRLKLGEISREYAEDHFGHANILSEFEFQLQSLINQIPS